MRALALVSAACLWRQAGYLGIDPTTEIYLLHIARDAVLAELPEHWEERIDASGDPYYVDHHTGAMTCAPRLPLPPANAIPPRPFERPRRMNCQYGRRPRPGLRLYSRVERVPEQFFLAEILVLAGGAIQTAP